MCNTLVNHLMTCSSCLLALTFSYPIEKEHIQIYIFFFNLFPFYIMTVIKLWTLLHPIRCLSGGVYCITCFASYTQGCHRFHNMLWTFPLGFFAHINMTASHHFCRTVSCTVMLPISQSASAITQLVVMILKSGFSFVDIKGYTRLTTVLRWENTHHTTTQATAWTIETRQVGPRPLTCLEAHHICEWDMVYSLAALSYLRTLLSLRTCKHWLSE